MAETDPLGLVAHHPPVVVSLLTKVTPVRVLQYLRNQKARLGAAPHIRRLLEANILPLCQSTWNMAFLVLKLGTSGYSPAQDLWEVKKRTETIHPTIPDP